MHDTLYGGRWFRTLNVRDKGVRDGWAIEVDPAFLAERVLRVLVHVEAWCSQPKAIRLNTGSEFIAERFMAECTERTIER